MVGAHGTPKKCKPSQRITASVDCSQAMSKGWFGKDQVKNTNIFAICLRYVFQCPAVFLCTRRLFFLLVYPMNCSAQRGNANEVAINIYIVII